MKNCLIEKNMFYEFHYFVTTFYYKIQEFFILIQQFFIYNSSISSLVQSLQQKLVQLFNGCETKKS